MKRATLSLAARLFIVLTAVAWAFALVGATAKLSGQAPDVEARVEAILKKLTLEEKIDLLGGYRDYYTTPIERLGILALRMSDGPMGVRNYGPATAFAAGIGLAATWDIELARRVGRAMGLEARARGVHILLAPGVNIYRVPMNGRNFEYFGEDPFLAAEMTVPFIQGVQAEGVIATVKHYALNNQEFQRFTISAETDERALHEIYLPAFKAAVQRGKVWAVMASYNRIAGVHATENVTLLTEILKKDWGFQGFVMSDWGATHDGVRAALAGLDLEMPSGRFMNRETLLPAVQRGEISEATIDDKVRRMLRALVSMGFLDREQGRPELPLYSAESRQVALAAAREGIVLLQNRDQTLPLDRRSIRSIAVFGPNAHPAVTGGGGSSRVNPFRAISVLDGLIGVAGPGVDVHYIPFEREDVRTIAAQSQFVSGEDGSPGLKSEYFDNADLLGTPAHMRRDQRINFRWGSGSPFDGWKTDEFSVRWTGFVAPEETAEYVFFVRCDDGVRLFVNGKLLIDRWQDQAAADFNVALKLEKGRLYPIRLEYYERTGESEIRFGWRKKPSRAYEAESALAAKADAAVVCVGFDSSSESEGADRTFELPPGQKELIQAIARSNKRTIVVINSGGAVDMADWLDDVGAVLEAWYPGQEGGQAVAEILFGDVNPSGKLPASFERRWEDSAAFGNYPGSSGKVIYREGIFVGYRHFDRSEVKPLFPFGHGLTYTRFEYGGLQLEKQGAVVRVRFQVRNTGSREGAEVAQVYVQDVASSLPRPVKELKGFRRVNLKPGEKKEVSFDLDRSAFVFYDPAAKNWKVEPGEFKILVGSSSSDIRLEVSLTTPQKGSGDEN